MPWLQVDTEVAQPDIEQLESLLEELDALAVWLSDAGDEPVLEPAPGTTPLWSNTIVTALFPAATDRNVISAALSAVCPDASLHFSEIDDRDWPAEWQRSLRPLQFGERIWVTQSVTDTVPADSVVIQLTPGMAFGTGEHPTTAMCLEWLEGLDSALLGQHVLDFGCGSGLLAIGAIKLGARRATATDIDPQALLATRQNADLNDCGDALDICTPNQLAGTRHDVLVANILSNTLIELGPTLNTLTAPGAHLALSGILSNQAVAVCNRWSEWATLSVTQQSADWVLLSGTKHIKTEN